jgi:hypothetical protein
MNSLTDHKWLSEHAMTGPEPQREEIDRKTSRSICDAVGDSLRQSLRPNFMAPAPELDRLVEEMRRRERESAASTRRFFR